MPDVTASPTFSLAVVVGAPAFITVLPQDKPVLVIEADLQRSRQLSQDLDGHPNPVTIITEVLTAEEGSRVEWHHYNDARLDGPTDLATWRQSYPNLQLLSMETRDGRLLKDLIQDWADKHAPKETLLLDIVLRQGDPLAALIGLGPWIQSVQRVSLEMTVAEAEWQDLVDRWLNQQGFQSIDQTKKAWNRDPIAMLQLILSSKDQTIAKLEEKLKEVTRQRDQRQARAADLAKQIAKMNGEINDILSLIDRSLGSPASSLSPLP